MINAAGYVRLDAAEHDPARCRRGNTIGAELLARTCARHGLPLATFSSDLVFDGAATRPYVESDPVGPLSVYGKCKADAERLVVAVHAHAPVVRTSTLFGTADPTDPLHEALDALARGVRWDGAGDVRMSPTYVPDVVNASLDLLLDGAAGIWHLSNAGDVSWFELVSRAAATCGYDPQRVWQCRGADLGWVAPHPAYSVLGSERGQLLRPLEEALEQFALEWRARSVPQRTAV